MYSEPEFPYPSSRSKMETIKYYFYEETEFMPATNFFNDDRNILIRRNGVSIIAKGQVKECAKKMIDLCRRTNILIDTPRSGIHSASSEAVTVPQKETKEAGTPEVKEIQQNKNKAVVVDDSSEEEEENDRTALINKQRQDIGKMETSQLQVQEGWAKLSDKKDVAAEENETSISEIEEELIIHKSDTLLAAKHLAEQKTPQPNYNSKANQGYKDYTLTHDQKPPKPKN
ncbi:hypothetical protein TSUD_101070 [Trifolium subterraneum]|uniref:Uncharacterized protein n=1 Tax=Trifolium subterraneum TaxID=3900 RepID=A0A2Z6NCI9_TRISU|nr:hypothetical protein TSUD_101070 [Trifolium subterraneum]